MCLYRILKGKKKNLPSEITAYKAVVKDSKGKYRPPVFDGLIIKKENRVDVKNTFMCPEKGGRYKPYFHSFRSIAACKKCNAFSPGRYIYIKIKIKKRHITTIGTLQLDIGREYQTVVSRAYSTDFEEVYFKE